MERGSGTGKSSIHSHGKKATEEQFVDWDGAHRTRLVFSRGSSGAVTVNY